MRKILSKFYEKLPNFLKKRIIKHVVDYKFSNIILGNNVTFIPKKLLENKIQLNEGVRIDDNTKIRGNISIGNGTRINPNCEFCTAEDGYISIGKYCAIARGVVFQQDNHIIDKPSLQFNFYKEYFNSLPGKTFKGNIKVGNDVWVGTRSIILSGVTIGNGAVIGAGSIVTKNVRPYEVVGGAPGPVKFPGVETKTYEK